MKKNKTLYFFAPSLIVFILIIGVILFPNESLESATSGLDIWVNVLIPSLLPFIIGANLIVSLKFVDIIGFIINPITKLIFNVSGKSALVFAISMVSGYPVGAKLASELRNSKEISKFEAQRLISFCSTSGPLFIIGSVATGMLKNINLGYVMIICHYLGAIAVGLIFRNYGREKLKKSKDSIKENISQVIYSKGNDGFFVLFGNAVHNGVNTLLLIGGFVIIFSVIFEILSLFKVVYFMSVILHVPLSLIGVSRELCQAFISGLFEMTIGCANVSALTFESELIRAVLCNFLIAFSGLSILAQCCSFIAKTDLNVGVYILSKFLHGIFAAFFTSVLYKYFELSKLTSNFGNLFDTAPFNILWNNYLDSFKIIVPVILVVYLISSLYILNNKKTLVR